MKHVCFFITNITTTGGIERVTTQIANLLEPHHKISIVSLYESEKQTFFELSNSIFHTALYARKVRGATHYPAIVSRLTQYVVRKKVDILVDVDGLLDLYSLPVKALTGVKVVSWEHFNFAQNFGTPLRKISKRLSAKFSDGIITLTQTDNDMYRNNLKIHCPIITIHNPMPSIVESLAYQSQSKIILSAGRLTYQKGFDTIPEIAREVFTRHPDWTWHILGEGEDRELLQKRIDNENLSKNIILEGKVTDVDTWYKRSGFYVMTSRFEGLPMVLLEAKAHHLPIISFACLTGPSDIIRDKVNGYLLQPNDISGMAAAINSLIEHENKRIEMSNNSQLDSELFSKKYILDQWLTFLKAL